MELTDEMLERIDKYLLGDCSSVEQVTMEMEINENPDLAAEVEHQRQIHLGFQALGIRELRNNLENIHRIVVDEKPKVNDRYTYKKVYNLWSRRIFAGVSVAVTLLILWIVWPTNQGPDANLLFAKYEKDLEVNTSYNRERNSDEYNEVWQKAITYYRTSQYDSAASTFEIISFQQKEYKEEAWINAGLSYLKARQFENAILNLSKALQMEDYYDRAYWYLSLCYLSRNKEGDINQCKKTLQEMINRLKEANKSAILRHKAENLLNSLRLIN